MSIYAALKFDIPVIAYCALHQVRKGTKREDYERTMSDLHRLINEQSSAIAADWSRYQSEAASHVVQRQQSLLMQFLSTPLKSDLEEIQHILRSQLSEYEKRILPAHTFGVLMTSEGRVAAVNSGNAAVKKLLVSGKKYLTALGFHFGKGRTDIYESMFVFEGGQNLDVIEHMVRDRIGIYSPVHGKHIREFASYAYAAYNLVYLSGSLQRQGRTEASLFFSKGETHYSPFRNALKEMLESAQARFAFPSVSVWQRKLGLGSGSEFVLRIQGDRAEHLVEFFGQLPKLERKEFVTRALARGNLLVKDMVGI